VFRAISSLLVLVFCCSLTVGAAGTTAADGSRDFDFNVGVWHTSITRLVSDSTGHALSFAYTGTVTVRKVLDGAANTEELEADGPTGHLEFLNVRLYNESSHQWTLNGVSRNDATLGDPMYGAFKDGRGTFYDQEAIDGRLALVRQTFYDITPSSYKFEQAISHDGGATWRPNFVAALTRISASAPSEGHDAVMDTSHDFDFNYATWHTKITTYDRAKEGTVKSAKLQGTVAVRKLWHGRALMEEIHASGGIAGITLFLYDPQTKQWSQTFAGKGDGVFERSMVGGFTRGVGTLVAFPSANDGEMQLVREVWSDIRPTTHHFEIQYSADGGATWQSSFVADLARVGSGL
jgi:hypothetical protein